MVQSLDARLSAFVNTEGQFIPARNPKQAVTSLMKKVGTCSDCFEVFNRSFRALVRSGDLVAVVKVYRVRNGKLVAYKPRDHEKKKRGEVLTRSVAGYRTLSVAERRDKEEKVMRRSKARTASRDRRQAVPLRETCFSDRVSHVWPMELSDPLRVFLPDPRGLLLEPAS